jgi:hypothetical protein
MAVVHMQANQTTTTTTVQHTKRATNVQGSSTGNTPAAANLKRVLYRVCQ